MLTKQEKESSDRIGKGIAAVLAQADARIKREKLAGKKTVVKDDGFGPMIEDGKTTAIFTGTKKK